MRFPTLAIVLFSTIAGTVFGNEPPVNSKLVVDESFERTELGKGWNATTGEWKVVDGVLRGKEIAKEKHSAALRRVVETQNAVYDLKFRFIENGKTFHFGFDPKRGELEKKGHLFSVVVTPDHWQILKHVDKNRRKEDPNEVLSREKTSFEMGTWYSLRVTTWGTHVKAMIDGKETLAASHPTFSVAKPTLVFRCLGDGIEVDDIKVWVQQQ